MCVACVCEFVGERGSERERERVRERERERERESARKGGRTRVPAVKLSVFRKPATCRSGIDNFSSLQQKINKVKSSRNTKTLKPVKTKTEKKNNV